MWVSFGVLGAYIWYFLYKLLKNVCEKKFEHHTIFVNLINAIVSINYDALRKAVTNLDIPDKMFRVVITFHQNMKDYVVHEENYSIPLELLLVTHTSLIKNIYHVYVNIT